MATATKILLMLLLPSCTIPSANTSSNKDMDIDITSLMDTTLFCSVLKGVPKNIVSADSWLQIRHANRVNPKKSKIVASLLWNGGIEVNAEFQRLAPSTTAKGNISEGWLETTIEKIPPSVYGNYSCVVVYHEGTSGHLEYKPRVIYIDQMSSGVLSSEPAGFEGKVIQKLQFSCIESSSYFCNKTFPVTLTSDDKNDSVLQEGIMLTWKCGSGKETCYLKDVWMNRTEKFNCITGHNASVSPNTRKCNTRDLTTGTNNQNQENKTITINTRDLTTGTNNQNQENKTITINTRDLTTGTNNQNQENKTITIILRVFGGVVGGIVLLYMSMICLFLSDKYLYPIYLHPLLAPMPYFLVHKFYAVRNKRLTDAHPTATGQDKTNPGSKSLDEVEASASNTEALDLEEIVTEESRSVGSKVINPPEDTAAEIKELTADGTKAMDAVRPKQAKGMNPDELRARLIAYQTECSNSSSV